MSVQKKKKKTQFNILLPNDVVAVYRAHYYYGTSCEYDCIMCSSYSMVCCMHVIIVYILQTRIAESARVKKKI